MTDKVNDVSGNITKTLTQENNKAVATLKDKLSEMMNDSGIMTSLSLSPLHKITHQEHTSQFKLKKDPDSNRINDLSIRKNKTSYAI